MHFLLIPSPTGRMFDLDGNSGDGEGVEGWRRSALELEPRASSTVDGSTRELHAIDDTRDNEFHELQDKECLGLNLVTIIDLQDQHRSELVSRHLEEDARRQFAIMYASRLDPLVEGRNEVQGINRARVAEGDANTHKDRCSGRQMRE